MNSETNFNARAAEFKELVAVMAMRVVASPHVSSRWCTVRMEYFRRFRGIRRGLVLWVTLSV